MTSPMIDEDQMVRLLDVTPTPDHVGHMQSGATLLLVDAFDRRLPREQFLTAMTHAFYLADSCGRLALLHSCIRYAQGQAGMVLLEDLQKAHDKVEKQVENAVKSCLELAELMRKCPMDEDKIH